MAATEIIVRAKSEQIILQISSEVEIDEVHVSLLNSSSSKVTKECLVLLPLDFFIPTHFLELCVSMGSRRSCNFSTQM